MGRMLHWLKRVTFQGRSADSDRTDTRLVFDLRWHRAALTGFLLSWASGMLLAFLAPTSALLTGITLGLIGLGGVSALSLLGWGIITVMRRCRTKPH